MQDFVKDLSLFERGKNMSTHAVDLVLPGLRGGNESGEPSWRRYNLILVPRYAREFFPGYHESFVMETDMGGIETWVTSAEGTSKGDRLAGKYICTPKRGQRTHPDLGSLSEWYSKHPELEVGDVLTIANQVPLKYELSSKKIYDYMYGRLEKFRGALKTVDQSMDNLRELPHIDDALVALEKTREFYDGEISKLLLSIRQMILKPTNFTYNIGPDGFVTPNLTPEELGNLKKDMLDSLGR